MSIAAMNTFLDDESGYALAALCMHELVCDNYQRLDGDIGIYAWRDMTKARGCVVHLVDSQIGTIRTDMCWYNDLGMDAFDFEYCAECFEWFVDGDDGMPHLTRLMHAVQYAPSNLEQTILDAADALRTHFLGRLEESSNGKV